MKNKYFILALLIAITFLTTTTVTAVPALEKRDCSGGLMNEFASKKLSFMGKVYPNKHTQPC